VLVVRSAVRSVVVHTGSHVRRIEYELTLVEFLSSGCGYKSCDLYNAFMNDRLALLWWYILNTRLESYVLLLFLSEQHAYNVHRDYKHY